NERWRESEFGEGTVRANGRRAQSTVNGWRWFGLKVHARNLPLQADLEMHIIKNGYVGLTRLPNNEVDVCGLFRRASAEKVGRGVLTAPLAGPAPPHGWPHVFENRLSNLCQRLAKASLDQNSSCSVAGLSLHPQRATDLPELCIGDSLTMTPPV